MANLNQPFFDKNYVVTQSTFPTKTELNELIHIHNFNQLLVIIKNKIISAVGLMQKHVSITNQELSEKFHPTTIEEVKTFLLSKNYTITCVEDSSNNITGWKIYWK